jgi:Tannase and feruloyl esterase
MIRRTSTIALMGSLAATVILSQIAAGASCESLTSLKLPDTTIDSAQAVAAGAFAPPPARGRGFGKQTVSFKDLPAFCRVTATVKPSSDSDIKIEVWMPAAGWNQKFEADGNGGFTGSINPATLAAALDRGYSTAMTDTGHQGGSASFAAGHPEKVIDFGYRAVHEMVVKAKAIMAAYYGQGPKYSYWNGCSAGGRQGLKEAQMFPDDFNGVVAGAPAIYWTGRAAQAISIAQGVHESEDSAIPAAKLPALHKAVLEACDALDGVKDGVIENPTRCHFDPKSVECKGADSSDCLTSAQVETAERIYTPVRNPRTKEEIFPGLEPGSEMGWGTLAGARPFGLAVDNFKYVVFQNPNWDYKSLNFDSDIAKAREAASAIDATDPNLKPFFARKGKIIQYQGWADQQIASGNSVMYYKSVLKKMGGLKKVKQNYRLFMVPGMGHCQGGDGTSTFDMRKALEEWVEAGKAPDQIIASRVRDGKVDRTRPLCPYPEEAVYKGSGSTDEAANFSCKTK